jgi:mannitol/fructose-specific phosphotransferase system IIA component (Ntr-type)
MDHPERERIPSPLAAYVLSPLIATDLKVRTREEVIDALLDLVDAQGLLVNRAEARRALLAREKLMSTAMDGGIAIPHARTDAVARLVCALGIVREGMACGAPDGNPTFLFIMTLSPVGTTSPQVQFMATLLRAIDSVGRERLLAAQTGAELRERILGEAF